MTKEPSNKPAQFSKESEDGAGHQLVKRYQVFISYARQDSGWMHAIRENLDSLPDFQIDSWVDKNNLGPGQNIDVVIKEGIKSSDIALLLISQDFVESEYINKELKWIKDRAKEGMVIVYAPISTPDNIIVINEYLKKKQFAEDLSTIPIDTPLPPDPSQMEDAPREGQVKQVVSGIRRVIDPRFALLERNLDKKYIIQGKIAEGDFAIIYRARQESFSYEFAIKVLKEPRDLDWFQPTIGKASAVTGIKNIVPIFDHRFRSSLSFCILKYVEGETLSSYIQNNHPISVEFASNVIRKIGEALLQVRAEKAFRFVFFNIRPENILLESDTQEPFLSLAVRPQNRRGLAHLEELEKRHCRSKEEWAYLVPEYLSPQSEEPEPSITDQYLLGLMAYQMLTGKIPERVSRDALKSPKTLTFENLDSIQSCRGNFDHLFPVIGTMLSLNPQDRFSSLSDAISAISNPEMHSLELVKRSYRRCAGNESNSEAFFTDFYDAFLGKSEEARRLFKIHGYSVAENTHTKKSKKWRNQRWIVRHAILLLITYFEHQMRGETCEPTILAFHRDKHRQPKLHPEQDSYQAFQDALLDTLQKHDEAWTKSETIDHDCYWKELWKAVMMPGIQYMMAGAAGENSA